MRVARRAGFTKGELAGVIAILVVVALIVLPALARVNPGRERALCQNNMKQLGIVLRQYAEEDAVGSFPTVQKYITENRAADGSVLKGNHHPLPQCEKPNDHKLCFDAPSLYPDYLNNVAICSCPADGSDALIRKGLWYVDGDPSKAIDLCRVDSISYNYLGYVLLPDQLLLSGADPNDPPLTENPGLDTLAAVADKGYTEALLSIVNAGPDSFDEDITYMNARTGEEARLHRLRKGVERLFITCASFPAITTMSQSAMPVLWDRVSLNAWDSNHVLRGKFGRRVGQGSNVLYMDGHVEFHRYPGDFPVCRYMAVVTQLMEQRPGE